MIAQLLQQLDDAFYAARAALDARDMPTFMMHGRLYHRAAAQLLILTGTEHRNRYVGIV